MGGARAHRPLVGVFALQGDFARHRTAWERAGADTREVRTATDLLGLDALSLPGGESTSMLRLLMVTGLYAPFEEALARLPVFATCAGAILLGHTATGLPAPTFGTLDLDVARNAYGRQIDSFTAELDAPVLGPGAHVTGVFIRAPRFTRVGEGLEVVARRGDEVVGVRDGRHVALAFHPELTADGRLFAWFLATALHAPAPRGARAPAANPAAVRHPEGAR